MSIHPTTNPTNSIANKLPISAAALLFFVLLFRFLAQLPENTASPAAKGSQFLDILIVAVTVIVVAIPG